MLLKIPFETAGKMFKHDISKICEVLSFGHPVTATAAMRQARTSWKVAWTALQALAKAEYVVQEGKKYVATDRIRQDFLILNIRDSLSDRLLRWKFARPILYQLYAKPGRPLTEISRNLGLPYITVRATVRALRECGLVEREIRPELVIRPSEPVELVPRMIHQKILRHFISALKTYCPEFDEAIVVFGDCSWGKPTISLDVAVITATPDPNRMAFVAKYLAYAAKNVAANFGASIELSMMAKFVWSELMLGVVDCVSPIPGMIVDGICIYGQVPSADDFFELGREVSPLSEEQMEEMEGKGYIKRTVNGKHVYTKKAVEKWLERPKSAAFEEFIKVEDKKIRLIGVAPPNLNV